MKITLKRNGEGEWSQDQPPAKKQRGGKGLSLRRGGKDLSLLHCSLDPSSPPLRPAPPLVLVCLEEVHPKEEIVLLRVDKHLQMMEDVLQVREEHFVCTPPEVCFYKYFSS